MTDAAVVGDGSSATVCPECGQPVAATDLFCESCGAALTAESIAPTPAPVAERTIQPVVAGPSQCSCGGDIDADGYCIVCGLRAPTERDHFTEQPVANVAAVCDKGVVHTRNEDAAALAALGDRVVMVVCDGVTSATDSDVASLAAARAARDLLAAAPDPPSASPAVVVEHWTSQLSGATAAAQQAATSAGSASANSDNPASTTFVAAVVDGPVLVTAWVGDSRCYWLPESGPAIQVTTDDSWASDQIAQGVPRKLAEADMRAHAITRWLGPDSPGGEPSNASLPLDAPGWMLVCSDGLWNYCSPADELRALVADRVATVGAEPLAVASALCDWANNEGGHDNVTVALARLETPEPDPTGMQSPAPTRSS